MISLWLISIIIVVIVDNCYGKIVINTWAGPFTAATEAGINKMMFMLMMMTIMLIMLMLMMVLWMLLTMLKL